MIFMSFCNKQSIIVLKAWLSNPYGLCEDSKIKFIYSVVNPLFIAVFLWFFGPFGLALFPDEEKLKLILWYCIVSGGITIVHIYLIQNIVLVRPTYGTTILWMTWILSVCGLGNFIVWEMLMNNGSLIWILLPKMIVQTYLVGTLSNIFVILLYEKQFLKKRIRFINQVNVDILKFQSNNSGRILITITSSNLNEAITMEADSLLYITSEDNYAEITWFKEGQIKRNLIRKTLSDLEKELKNQSGHFERCHNGYIVNINRIKSVSGNSGGYRISIDGTDKQIPVSRKYREGFFRAVNR